MLLNMKCVLIFSTIFSETCLILRRTEWDMIKNVYFSLCKVHVFLVQLQRNAYFLYRFSKKKKLKYQISRKSVQSEPICSMRTDGRADRHDDATVAFRHFAMASKKTTWARRPPVCPDIAPNWTRVEITVLPDDRKRIFPRNAVIVIWF